MKASSSLLTGRRDVIVVASVSCIYGIGNPEEFGKNVIRISVGDQISRNKLLFAFVDILYSRTEADFNRGNFRVKGDTVDIFIAYGDFAYRIIFWGDEVEFGRTNHFCFPCQPICNRKRCTATGHHRNSR